ncbi:hypothetical protein M5K25_002672 [Dendrobium thyrsiflorum]|uniref:Uncharacterized protein n=1 Tax=Dendrobium thyrsiflorum TaxID=117978 RepID=A0ABD0VP58_DENTH
MTVVATGVGRMVYEALYCLELALAYLRDIFLIDNPNPDSPSIKLKLLFLESNIAYIIIPDNQLHHTRVNLDELGAEAGTDADRRCNEPETGGFLLHMDVGVSTEWQLEYLAEDVGKSTELLEPAGGRHRRRSLAKGHVPLPRRRVNPHVLLQGTVKR